ESRLAGRDRLHPESDGEPARVEGRGAPLSVQLQAQDAAAGRDDPRVRAPAASRGRRRDPAGALPQVLDRNGRWRPRRDPSRVRGRAPLDGDRAGRIDVARRASGVTEYLALPAASELRGEVRVPPSKSATNRALVAAALTGSPVSIEGPLESDDTEALRACLLAMGARIEPASAG